MSSKRFAVVIFLVLSSIVASGQLSTSYPEEKGIVSDYADKLSQPQIEELTHLIQDYERQTSIEMAVVVIDDLQGQSARNYAIGLGEAWGVGKAGRNNGIVLLWAPNQRAYSLRIASGLAGDLSDSDAAQITQEYLVPNFRRERYYDGLKATVLAITARLGNLTWDERQQRRAQAAAEDSRQTKQALVNAGGFVLFMAIVIVLLIAIYRWRRRQERLAELAGASGQIAGNLAKAEANAPQIRQSLDDFGKEAPEQDLSKLRSDLVKQPERISAIRQEAAALDFAKLDSYEEMVSIRTRTETEADLLESVQQVIANIKASKQRSQSLLEQLSKENFAIPEVRDGSKRSQVDQLLNGSRLDYEKARSDSSLSLVDWILINEMLNRSNSRMQEAIRYSQAEPYVASTAFSSGASTSFSGSSGDSSSFGGGGGFSGGSGSDGSY